VYVKEIFIFAEKGKYINSIKVTATRSGIFSAYYTVSQ